jgi:hypothetical protein
MNLGRSLGGIAYPVSHQAPRRRGPFVWKKKEYGTYRDSHMKCTCKKESNEHEYREFIFQSKFFHSRMALSHQILPRYWKHVMYATDPQQPLTPSHESKELIIMLPLVRCSQEYHPVPNRLSSPQFPRAASSAPPAHPAYPHL